MTRKPAPEKCPPPSAIHPLDARVKSKHRAKYRVADVCELLGIDRAAPHRAALSSGLGPMEFAIGIGVLVMFIIGPPLIRFAKGE